MSNQSSEKDSNIPQYIIECAIVLLVVGVLLSLSIVFYKEIFSFLGFIISGTFNIIIDSLVYIYQITKPINKAVGLYFTILMAIASVWSLCVMAKIEQKFKESKKQWRFINKISSVIFILSSAFMIPLSVELRNYDYLYGVSAILLVLFITFYVYGNDSSERSTYELRKSLSDMHKHHAKTSTWSPNKK